MVIFFIFFVILVIVIMHFTCWLYRSSNLNRNTASRLNGIKCILNFLIIEGRVQMHHIPHQLHNIIQEALQFWVLIILFSLFDLVILIVVGDRLKFSFTHRTCVFRSWGPVLNALDTVFVHTAVEGRFLFFFNGFC